jgi:hypothetical protein
MGMAESQAGIEVLPEASVRVESGSRTDRETAMKHPTLKAILAAFAQAVTAVQTGNLDAVMNFYSKAYNYHGLKSADVRRIWSEVFMHYRDVSSTHLFSDIKIVRVGDQQRADITCTGGLYGTEVEGGRKITLDSWFREVHYLVHEDGAWRFLGNAGSVPKMAPPTSAPHHPLF